MPLTIEGNKDHYVSPIPFDLGPALSLPLPREIHHRGGKKFAVVSGIVGVGCTGLALVNSCLPSTPQIPLLRPAVSTTASSGNTIPIEDPRLKEREQAQARDFDRLFPLSLYNEQTEQIKVDVEAAKKSELSIIDKGGREGRIKMIRDELVRGAKLGDPDLFNAKWRLAAKMATGAEFPLSAIAIAEATSGIGYLAEYEERRPDQLNTLDRQLMETYLWSTNIQFTKPNYSMSVSRFVLGEKSVGDIANIFYQNNNPGPKRDGYDQINSISFLKSEAFQTVFGQRTSRILWALTADASGKMLAWSDLQIAR